MTCLPLVVDSSEALMPEPAVGRPLAFSEGHTSEHPLIAAQLLLPPWSLVNSYSVRPEPLTRMLPRLVWRNCTVAAALERAAGRLLCALACVAAPAALAKAIAKKTWVRFIVPPNVGVGRARDSHLYSLDTVHAANLPADQVRGRQEISAKPKGVGLFDRRQNLGEEMPRYVVERDWTALEEEEMASKGALSKRILGENEQFSPVTWEHSHVVMDEDGQLKSFCVYSSPNTELITGARCAARRPPGQWDLRDRRGHLARRLRLIISRQVEFCVQSGLDGYDPA